MEKAKNKKFKLKMPNIVALLVILTIVAAVLTWIIPAGTFERIKEGSRTVVVPGTFQLIDQTPQGIWDIFMAITKGFQGSAAMIFMIFFISAAIYVLEKSGTIDACFSKLVTKVKGKEWFAILIVMLAMTMGGATGVFGNATLALIPIGIILSEALGYDKFLGFAMIFFGSFSGFNVGWANVGTIGIAQEIAELPMFSGLGVRVGMHIVNFLLCYGFVMLYANKVKKSHTSSLNYEDGMAKEQVMGVQGNTDNKVLVELNWKHIVSILLTAVAIAVIVIGSLKYKWGPDHYSTVFLMLTVVLGLLHGFGVSGTADAFINGCKTMVMAAFIVGFARAITIVMSNGQILDTVVYYLSIPVSKFGAVIGANLMLLSNILVNFFISSGSGQATAVMPIMVPIADLTGITRQVAVQTYQFGDGFTNCIIPTVGTLMGGLGFANTKYSKYLKWVMPLITIQILLSFAAITVLQMMQWTGL